MKLLTMIQEWYNDWIKSIQASNDQAYKETIQSLEKRIVVLQEYSNKLIDENEELTSKNEIMESLITELEKKLVDNNKHATLNTFKLWMQDNIKPKAVYYDFGHGKKRVHTIFADALKEKELVWDFIKNDLDIDPSVYPDADTMVGDVSYKFSTKYPTVKYYAMEKELYGVAEYWALPSETIAKLRNRRNTAYECDDVMILKFVMFRCILDEYFPEDSWRIRGFIADLWNAGGHALLAWVSSKFNDWVAIETTYMDTRQSQIKNYKLRDQMFYQMRYSFDEHNEYVKL